MSLTAHGVRMSALQPFEIDTIADGRVVETNAFVRAFFNWTSDEPDEITVWCMIGGVRCVEAFTLEQFRIWTSQPATHLVVRIMDRGVLFPRGYVEIIPEQIDWLKGGRKGPCPGTPEDQRP